MSKEVAGLKTNPETLGNKTLVSIFEERVKETPSRTATNFLGNQMSYRFLHQRVNQVAQGLQDMGFTKGDRLAILLPNCSYFIIFYYAALKIGAIAVPCNPLYTKKELREQIANAGAKAVVTFDLNLLADKVMPLAQDGTISKLIVCSFPRALPQFKSFLFRTFKSKELAQDFKNLPEDRKITYADLINNQGKPTPVPLNADDPAVLQYTGGTTGAPKGATLTHRNISANCEQCALWAKELISSETQETILVVLPLFHVFAMTFLMNYGLSIGAKLVLLPRFEMPKLLRAFKSHKPTIFAAVPTLYHALTLHRGAKSLNLSSLKIAISGGDALPIPVKEAFFEQFKIDLVEGYGLSEASPVLSCNPYSVPNDLSLDPKPQDSNKGGSAGLPFPGVSFSIRDLKDPLHELPQGEKGELCVKGPNVMPGYWNEQAETEKVFVGDYLKTGDIAYLDHEGYLYLVDRAKDMIISSGYNIYPKQIETVLLNHPSIAEALVIGISHPYRGEVPKAYVVLHEGKTCTKETIRTYLSQHLSSLKVPKQIEIRSELPKTFIGKASRKALREEEKNKLQSKEV